MGEISGARDFVLKELERFIGELEFWARLGIFEDLFNGFTDFFESLGSRGIFCFNGRLATSNLFTQSSSSICNGV